MLCPDSISVAVTRLLAAAPNQRPTLNRNHLKELHYMVTRRTLPSLKHAFGMIACLSIGCIATLAVQTKMTYAKPVIKEKPKVGQPVVHFEIGCDDTAKTREFYSSLFNWQIDKGPAGTID